MYIILEEEPEKIPVKLKTVVISATELDIRETHTYTLHVYSVSINTVYTPELFCFFKKTRLLR